MHSNGNQTNEKKKFKIASLFAGCGGLDLGFQQANFDVIWANEYDKSIWPTYEYNHPHTTLIKDSIRNVKSQDIPDVDGVIGGPPCQSWSLAGAMRGADDPRGRLFFEYMRILEEKKPLFFLAENVAGIVSSAHIETFNNIIKSFKAKGYTLSYKLLNAKNYGVPQDRKRVIIVGYSDKMNQKFIFPDETHYEPEVLKNILFSKNLKPIESLEKAIGDLSKALPAAKKNRSNMKVNLPNHEYMTGGFSTIYMSRNRKRDWNEPSFTIQAGGRHAPLHPNASKMIKISADKWQFNKKQKNNYRRMTVRECARVQTFPDNFIFKYDAIADGYKMVGNAVPVLLAKVIAQKIILDLTNYKNKQANFSNSKNLSAQKLDMVAAR